VGERAGQRHGAHALAGEGGPAGVAAAYGFPLRCLRVTILTPGDSYARADFNHASHCGLYAWDPTAIFHWVTGSWRTVLNADQYHCPVGTLPAVVQTRLDVCP
jgi:hypothetical protein